MIQVRAFNTSLGGHIPNYCLDNVRRGFGIENKYASAWEAWLHTEQHPDRNIPDGVDVPLYYSYIATIDGSNQNYGHINVRLANGTVWSDGNVYDSIEAYTAHHSPVFVGWGESVNDYKIIQEGGDIVNPTAPDVHSFFKIFTIDQRDATQAEVDFYMAHDIRDMYHDVLFHEILPKPAIVQAAFAELSSTPLNSPPYTDQSTYYANLPAAVMYHDLAKQLKKESTQKYKKYDGPQLYEPGN